MKPCLVFLLPDPIGITEGVELLQEDVLQSSQFVKNTGRRFFQTLILPHQIAGQGRLQLPLCPSRLGVHALRLALVDDQDFEAIIVVTEDDAIHRNVEVSGFFHSRGATGNSFLRTGKIGSVAENRGEIVVSPICCVTSHVPKAAMKWSSPAAG